MDETWMLDELAHAGAEHLDAEFIAGFDRKQGYPDPEEDLAAFAAHGLGPASVVVDLGAGTGQFALPAARRFGRVTAVDVSPAMLAALRDKAAANAGGPGFGGPGTDDPGLGGPGTDDLGPHRVSTDSHGPDGAGWGRLEYVRGGFLSYAPAEPVDGVYTRNALHQLPDFWKAVALQRVAGMLRPGGVLRLRDLVYDFGPGEVETVFAGWFAGAAADPAAGYTAADYAEHIRTEYSTFRWLLEPMLAAAGFAVAEVSYTSRLYAAYTCVKTS